MVITAAHLSPLLALLFGILILILPRILNYLVAIYLILSGLLGLGLLVVPARTTARATAEARAFDQNQQPIAFSLVHCHQHTPFYRRRTANDWTTQKQARQARIIRAMATPGPLDRTAYALNEVPIVFQ